MDNFLDIEGITEPLAELIETAGFLDRRALVISDAETILEEITKANEILGLVEDVPTIEDVDSWRSQIKLDARAEAIAQERAKKTFRPKVKKTFSRVFHATPLSEDFIAEKKLNVSKFPSLIVGEVAEPEAPEEELQETRPGGGSEEVFKMTTRTSVVAASRKKNTKSVAAREMTGMVLTSPAALSRGTGRVQPLVDDAENDVTRSTKAETNEGVNPESRKYVRGVLHHDAGKVYVGAIAFLISKTLLFLSPLPIIYILFNLEHKMWGLLAPALFFASAFIYSVFASKAMCPICRQRQFVPKACTKHLRAHRLLFLGTMIPTAVHVIIFKWFRCMFCGTSVRVKE